MNNAKNEARQWVSMALDIQFSVMNLHMFREVCPLHQDRYSPSRENILLDHCSHHGHLHGFRRIMIRYAKKNNDIVRAMIPAMEMLDDRLIHKVSGDIYDDYTMKDIQDYGCYFDDIRDFGHQAHGISMYPIMRMLGMSYSENNMDLMYIVDNDTDDGNSVRYLMLSDIVEYKPSSTTIDPMMIRGAVTYLISHG